MQSLGVAEEPVPQAQLQAAPAAERLKCKEWVALILLALTVLGINADQNLLAPNLTAIAKEFGFSNIERDEKLGGQTALAFFCIGGVPMAVIAGSMADMYNRKRLFVLITILGEIPCLCIYFTKTYWQLFALRALSGISIGGFPPILFSLLGDIVPVSKRSLATCLMAIALGAGVAGGQLLAGFFGSDNGWRTPFLLVGAPTLILATLVLIFVEEPMRAGKEEAFLHPASVPATAGAPAASPSPASPQANGDQQQQQQQGTPHENAPTATAPASAAAPPAANTTALATAAFTPTTATTVATTAPHPHPQAPPPVYAERIDWHKARALFLIPSNVLLFAQSIPGCIPWGVMNTFFADFIAQDRGLGVKSATQVLLAFGAGGAIGTVGGGFLCQWLYNRRKFAHPLLMGTTLIIAILPAVYIINARISGDGFPSALGASFLAGIFACITAGNVRAVLLNVNAPETRGSAFAIFALLDNLGKGFGPVMAASMIASTGSRVTAFNIAVCFWAICGCCLIGIAFTLGKDEERLQARLRAKQGLKDGHAAGDGDGGAGGGGETGAGAEAKVGSHRVVPGGAAGGSGGDNSLGESAASSCDHSVVAGAGAAAAASPQAHWQRRSEDEESGRPPVASDGSGGVRVEILLPRPSR